MSNNKRITELGILHSWGHSMTVRGSDLTSIYAQWQRAKQTGRHSMISLPDQMFFGDESRVSISTDEITAISFTRSSPGDWDWNSGNFITDEFPLQCSADDENGA